MIDSLLAALVGLFSVSHFAHLLVGVLIGLVVGILPGLGGVAGFSLVLPFVYGMDQVSALALLIGMVAVVNTSDVFTAILMGIAGSASGQVTVIEGFPMAKRGEAARALGAAFFASMIGGLFGAAVLTVAVLVARPAILAVGFGEQLMLVLLGLSMAGIMTGVSPAKGLAACGLGLLLATVGSAPATGEWRLTAEFEYLVDGIPLTILALGIFAIPEIVDLLRADQAISQVARVGSGWLAGLRDCLRNFALVLRCSSIGALIGALPGLGGSVVDWVSYGHAVQTTRDKSQFGKGEIRGLVGPEAANNAKEGGALIPTILFGIPGSGGMAVFLGGMVLIGIQPGITMVERQLDLTYTIVWSLALANVLGTAICIFVATPIARLTTIRYAYLAPFMLMLIFFAAFQVSRSWSDMVMLFVLGVVGIYLKRFGWPRAALLIGFVLSGQLEVSTYQAVQVYGLSFLQRPLVIVLALVIAVSVFFAVRAAQQANPMNETVSRRDAPMLPQLLFTGAIIFLLCAALVDVSSGAHLTRLYPLIVGSLTLAFAAYTFGAQVLRGAGHPATFDAEVDYDRSKPDAVRAEEGLLWIAGLMLAIWLVGFTLGTVVFFLAFLWVKAGPFLVRNLALTLSAVLFLAVMSHLLVLQYPAGLLQSVVQLPWPLR